MGVGKQDTYPKTAVTRKMSAIHVGKRGISLGIVQKLTAAKEVSTSQRPDVTIVARKAICSETVTEKQKVRSATAVANLVTLPETVTRNQLIMIVLTRSATDVTKEVISPANALINRRPVMAVEEQGI